MIVPDLIKAVKAGREKARLEIQGKHCMNERIRKLLNDATCGLEPDLSPQRTITLNEMEKFAELIVEECVNICNQAILQNQDTLSKLNTDELAEKMIIHGSINQAQKLGKGIKEHFGVEE